MRCAEFLARYSDFRDGTITAARELRRLQRHLAQCSRCQGYDAALREGLDALRTAEPILPSGGFRRRLEARLAAERAVLRRATAPVAIRLAAGLLAATALVLLASDAARRSEPAAVPALPPVAFPKPVVNPGVPLVTFQDPRATVLAGNPSPYGTALVQPASPAR